MTVIDLDACFESHGAGGTPADGGFKNGKCTTRESKGGQYPVNIQQRHRRDNADDTQSQSQTSAGTVDIACKCHRRSVVQLHGQVKAGVEAAILVSLKQLDETMDHCFRT
jgi:hypothetical protein